MESYNRLSWMALVLRQEEESFVMIGATWLLGSQNIMVTCQTLLEGLYMPMDVLTKYDNMGRVHRV